MQLNKVVTTTLAAGALTWIALPCSNAQAHEESSLFQVLNDKVDMSAVVEVEMAAASDYDDNSTSDIALATMELGIEAAVNEWVTGNIVLLWEEDDTEPVDLDEATITIGNTDKNPLYLTAGLMTLPYGVYETNMVSDTLGLEMGETGGSAALVGLDMNGAYASVYGFNGDVNKAGDDDGVATFGANIGFAMENDSMSLDVGADWINNVSNSDGLSGVVPEETEDNISGIAAHVIFGMGNVSCIAEYVAASDSYTVNELAFNGEGAQPAALQLEAALTTELGGMETVFAVGYQTTEEALGLELPETRIMAAVGMGIMDNLALAIEYAHDEDYAEEDGGSGGDADQITAQLALEF